MAMDNERGGAFLNFATAAAAAAVGLAAAEMPMETTVSASVHSSTPNNKLYLPDRAAVGDARRRHRSRDANANAAPMHARRRRVGL